MFKFKVGKCYEWADISYDPFQVLSRTDKTILVRNANHQWRMRIRTNGQGDEYVIDSSVPKSYRRTFTSNATWETSDMGYKGGFCY